MFPTLIFLGLAAAQITYLVTTSVIFDDIRDWIIPRVNDKVGYLITCPWCFSAWASAAAVLAMHHRIDYDPIAWAVVWWIACLAFWVAQAIARLAEVE